MEADAGGEFPDAGADLEKTEAEGIELDRRVSTGA